MIYVPIRKPVTLLHFILAFQSIMRSAFTPCVNKFFFFFIFLFSAEERALWCFAGCWAREKQLQKRGAYCKKWLFGIQLVSCGTLSCISFLCSALLTCFCLEFLLARYAVCVSCDYLVLCFTNYTQMLQVYYSFEVCFLSINYLLIRLLLTSVMKSKPWTKLLCSFL